MKKIVSIFVLLLILSSCSTKYSFTGASIAPDVKTASILYFPSYAANAHPNLSQVFTQTLQNKFISLTNLQLVPKSGDLNLEGEIKEYKVTPSAIQSNETTALNRLTITVNVRFTNTKDDKQDFESSFSQFADFDSAKNLSEVEEGLFLQISEQMAQDIFNKSVTNW